MVAIAVSLLQSVLVLAGLGPKNLTELFGPSLSPGAQIILTKESRWNTDVRQRWSVYQAPTYLGAIKPATTVDIQHIIKVADANNIPFFATGGGHGISDYSRFEGIAIDLGAFKSVHLNKTANRLTIGAATEYSQLGSLLYSAGKELPLASCPCVGVIGATLGAGIGPLVGYRGLMLDALESVEMVTADGEFVAASAEQNPDLFWAIRGAGSNFGIVTSATYKVYDITNRGQVTVADLVYPAVANQSFWKTLQQYDHALPSKLALTVVALYNREIEQPLIVLHAVYFGPQEEGKKYLEPFKQLGPLVSNVGIIPQTEMFPADHGACTPNQRINLYTVALRHIDSPTLETFYSKLVNTWHEYPDYDGRLLIMRFANDGPMAVPDSNTAYPWRDAIAHINLENFYIDPGHDDSVNQFAKSARARFAATSGYQSLATYSNFAHGDEGPEAWYSTGHLSKLSALKRQWDPKGLFSWHNPVPLDWTEAEL